ncbi:AMMECR1, N-terminal [Lasallia pustulata]|nr:AMMECR1, N-terminal [Lasallia pustulata]
MATTAHCLFCFEVLSARLEKREPLNLSQVEELWAAYQSSDEGAKVPDTLGTPDDDDDDEDGEDDEALDDGEAEEEDPSPSSSTLQIPRIPRLQAPSPSTASTASTPSSLSAASSRAALGSASKSSSNSSFFSFARRSPQPSPLPPKKEEEHPLFVTWNTVSSRGHKTLRGCIGTFEPHPLESGLKSYALTS